MKTKFDVLLVGIKQRMQTCELEISQIATNISLQEEKKTNILMQISQMEIPNCGNSNLFKEIYEGKRAYLVMIDEIGNQIALLKSQKLQKQEEYKQYCLEFEKIKYLQQKEMKKILENLKRKEQAELDEIAVMRFYQQ